MTTGTKMSKHALDEGEHKRREHGRHTEHRENAVSVAALLEAALREGRGLWVVWGDNGGSVRDDEIEHRGTSSD